MKANQRKLQALIGGGILAFFSLAFLLFFSPFPAHLGGKRSLSCSAVFTNVGSLRVQAPVKISGVTVGRVTEIKLDPKSFKAEVTFQLNPAVAAQLSPEDHLVMIHEALMFGEAYVSIRPTGLGKQGKRRLQEGEKFQRTVPAKGLEDRIQELLSFFSSNPGSKGL